jgi:hypothetical protein
MGNANTHVITPNPCSTTLFPADFKDKPKELERFGIVLEESSLSEDTSPSFIKGRCPDGWYVERDGNYIINYYNEEGILCIYCSVDIEYSRVDIIFKSELYIIQERENIKKEMEEKKRIEDYEKYISEHFASEWSEENRYIVYYYHSGFKSKLKELYYRHRNPYFLNHI